MDKFIHNLKIAIPRDDRANFIKKIGVSYESFRRWIKKEAIPRGDHLIKIANELNCTIDVLLFGDISKKQINYQKEVELLNMEIKEYKERISELKGYNTLLLEKVKHLEIQMREINAIRKIG